MADLVSYALIVFRSTLIRPERLGEAARVVFFAQLATSPQPMLRAQQKLVWLVIGLSFAGCTAVREPVFRGNDPMSGLPISESACDADNDNASPSEPIANDVISDTREAVPRPSGWSEEGTADWLELNDELAPRIRRLPSVDDMAVTKAAWLTDGAALQLDPLERSLDPLDASLRELPEESTPHTLSERLARDWSDICSDHAEFYSTPGLFGLAGGIGVAALMANTGFDEQLVRDSYLDSIVLAPSDEFYEAFHEPKFLGEGRYTIPVFAIAALSEPLITDLPLGSETAEWGRRSLRTLLVGGPPMLGLQVLTGGGRPSETVENSEWQPLKDNNGVSGHAFMGAIPFMSAAKMTDNIWLKGGLYAASTLPAISRVNDDDHYVSQVFLGWWLAYLAESAIDRTNDPDSHHHFVAYPQANGIGFGVEFTR